MMSNRSKQIIRKTTPTLLCFLVSFKLLRRICNLDISYFGMDNVLCPSNEKKKEY